MQIVSVWLTQLTESIFIAIEKQLKQLDPGFTGNQLEISCQKIYTLSLVINLNVR